MDPVVRAALIAQAIAFALTAIGVLAVLWRAAHPASRPPFPKPYRAVAEPVRRHRRPAEWPAWLALSGWWWAA